MEITFTMEPSLWWTALITPSKRLVISTVALSLCTSQMRSKAFTVSPAYPGRTEQVRILNAKYHRIRIRPKYLYKPLHQLNFCNTLANVSELERHNASGASGGCGGWSSDRSRSRSWGSGLCRGLRRYSCGGINIYESGTNLGKGERWDQLSGSWKKLNIPSLSRLHCSEPSW